MDKDNEFSALLNEIKVSHQRKTKTTTIALILALCTLAVFLYTSATSAEKSRKDLDLRVLEVRVQNDNLSTQLEEAHNEIKAIEERLVQASNQINAQTTAELRILAYESKGHIEDLSIQFRRLSSLASELEALKGKVQSLEKSANNSSNTDAAGGADF